VDLEERTVTRPRISAAGATDPGRVRVDNEDRFYVDVERGIYLVVDGVGGHAAGEVAAAVACDVIVRRLERPTGTPEERVREAITLANNEIVRQSATSPAYAGMTCVTTLALLEESRLIIGHVGDSRLYVLTSRGIRKLTHDHSPVGEREDAREISELDAMRHPRRNEVYRDVGSALRTPDDPDFIEIVRTRFDDDMALLVCSDGLSDMLPASEIDRVIRRDAGAPARVARALIEAANEAGGTDNITAVYAEGPGFASTAGDRSPASRDESAEPSPVLSGQRARWLTLGLVLGLGIGLGIPSLLAFDIPLLPRPARTWVVGGTGPERLSTISDALRQARRGDVVAVEPGAYAEQLVLPEGVDLVAREPGTAVLVAPPGQPGWTALTATGRVGNRVSGLRVRGQPDAPMTVGVRLAGDNLVVEDVIVEGTLAIGIDVEREGAIVVRGCRFSEVTGTPLRIGNKAKPVIRQSLFVRSAQAAQGAAIDVAAESGPELVDNLFVGYGEGIRALGGPGMLNRSEELIRGNYRIRGTGAAH
jgi:serine/threonine protein phosphatase PrpC